MPTKWLQQRAKGSKNGHGMPPHRVFCGWGYSGSKVDRAVFSSFTKTASRPGRTPFLNWKKCAKDFVRVFLRSRKRAKAVGRITVPLGVRTPPLYLLMPLMVVEISTIENALVAGLNTPTLSAVLVQGLGFRVWGLGLRVEG